MQQSIKDIIIADMKAAMRTKNGERLGTIRLMLAAIKQREIDERIILTDEQVIALLEKMVKKRREAIKQYEIAQRVELVAQEQQEINIIQQYLPIPLSTAEITTLVNSAIAELGAARVTDMSKVMKALKPQVQGRVDMAMLSQLVQNKLSTNH